MNNWKEELNKKLDNKELYDKGTQFIHIPKLKQFIQELLDKQRAEIIDHISLNEGWEETEDIYRKHFGLEQKYNKLKGGNNDGN